MKPLPSSNDLQETFLDFAKFTFELLEKVDKDHRYLKFAAVNAQITLELFLKYYFVKLDRASEIRITKKGVLTNDFKDCMHILNHFFNTDGRNFDIKNEMVKLLEDRNLIVHKGLKTDWDRDFSESIVRTFLFIHLISYRQLGETLLFQSYLPHPISNNLSWKRGVEAFINKLLETDNFNVLNCLACGALSVVSGENLVLESHHGEYDRVCLNCLTSIDVSYEARLITCYVCGKNSYFIDALNDQPNQQYVGKCSECEANSFVRKCKGCDAFYHPITSSEVFLDGGFFCCKECFESVSDI